VRDGNPANRENWALVCSVCGAQFQMAETIDLVAGHFASEHPDLENPHFNTVWVGKGPPPKRKGRR
jgi:hypothetical protein